MAGQGTNERVPLAVGWCAATAPLPGVHSSRFSSLVIPEIRRIGSVLRFSADEGRTTSSSAPDSVPNHLWTLASSEQRQKLVSTLTLLENHPLAAPYQRTLALFPGPAVFFDCSLPLPVLSRFRHSTGGTDLNAEVRRRFGDRVVPFGDYAVRGWSSMAFLPLYPWGEEDLKNAAPAFVFSSAQLRAVAQIAPGTITKRISVPLRTVTADQVTAERTALRLDYGISEPTFICTCAPDEPLPASLTIVVEAWLRAQSAFSLTAPQLLLVARSAEHARVLLERLQRVVPREWRTCVRVVEPKSGAALESLIGLSDAFVDCSRRPENGPSVALLAALERGVPVILSDLGISEDLPPGTVLRIPVGYGEPQAYTRALVELANSVALRRELRRAALAFAREQSPAKTAAEIAPFLFGTATDSWQRFTAQGRAVSATLVELLQQQHRELQQRTADCPILQLPISRVLSDALPPLLAEAEPGTSREAAHGYSSPT